MLLDYRVHFSSSTILNGNIKMYLFSLHFFEVLIWFGVSNFFPSSSFVLEVVIRSIKPIHLKSLSQSSLIMPIWLSRSGQVSQQFGRSRRGRFVSLIELVNLNLLIEQGGWVDPSELNEHLRVSLSALANLTCKKQFL